MKVNQKQEISDMQHLIALHRQEEEDMISLSKSYNTSPFRHRGIALLPEDTRSMPMHSK